MEYQEKQVSIQLEKRLRQLIDAGEEKFRDLEKEQLRRQVALLNNEINLHKRRFRSIAKSACIGIVFTAILSAMMTAAIYHYVILPGLPLSDLVTLQR